MKIPMKISIYRIILFLILTLTACSIVEISDPISTDPENTNQQIKLISFDYNNSYKTSDPLSAEIWNKSENFIKFPNNYNIRIFEKTKKGWVEIPEKPASRLPPGDFVFNPIDGSSYIEMIGVFPDLPDLNRKYDLRIYVTGQMQKNDEIVDVFAFTDVTLKP